MLWCWVLSGSTSAGVAALLLHPLTRQHHGRRLQKLLYTMIACTTLYAGNTVLAWILGQPLGIAAWTATTVILAAGTVHLARRRRDQRRRDHIRDHARRPRG
jgi:hypothetical protein